MLFIFLTESIAQIDFIYINSFLKHFFKVTCNDKIVNIPLKGKSNYKDKGILNKIAQARNKFKAFGKSHVFLCVDVDKENTSSIFILNNEIENFCKGMNWSLVWFNEDVEDIFLGHRVEKSKKLKESIAFQKERKIFDVNKSLFLVNEPRKQKHSSNLFKVLAKFLKVK